MIKCENCSAMIDTSVAKCPYCGAINISGSESKYLNNLDSLRENMADLSSVEGNEVKKELSKSLKLMIIIAVSTVALIGIICLGVFIYNKAVMGQYESEEFIRAKLSWESENYPIMDTMYAERNFEELSDFVIANTTDNEPGVSAYYNWPHYHILEYYNHLKNFRLCGATLNTERSSTFWYIASAFEVLDDGYATLNETDTQLREDYRAEVLEGLRNNLNMTDEEIDSLFRKCHDKDNFMTFSLMQSEIDNYINNMNK